MQRLKSVDIIRGLSIIWMVFGHTFTWWVKEQWIIVPFRLSGDWLGSGAFLFISGVSAVLLTRSRRIKAETSPDYNMQQLKREYLFRALLIFIISIMYNVFIAISTLDPLKIWTWFILLTVAVSLFLGWFLFNTSKLLRVCLAGSIWVANYFILTYLAPYQGQFNVNGVLYHILYNSIDLDPLLQFFTFFLLGTVVGDILFDTYLVDDKNERKTIIKKKLLIPSIIAGVILIPFGIIFRFPECFQHRSFSWLIISLPMLLILSSLLFYIEASESIKVEKSYRFIYYFSYYSLTVYFTHDVLYLIFLQQLSVVFIAWILPISVIAIYGVLLRAIYNSKYRQDFSIKLQVGKLAVNMAKKIEEKKKENLSLKK